MLLFNDRLNRSLNKSQKYIFVLVSLEENRLATELTSVGSVTCPVTSHDLAIVDYDDFTSCWTRLLRVQLHQPADVFEEKKRYKDARDACFSCGVGFVMEGGNKAIRFIVINGSVNCTPTHFDLVPSWRAD